MHDSNKQLFIICLPYIEEIVLTIPQDIVFFLSPLGSGTLIGVLARRFYPGKRRAYGESRCIVGSASLVLGFSERNKAGVGIEYPLAVLASNFEVTEMHSESLCADCGCFMEHIIP